MKCDVVSTRKGWSSWCKTHNREQNACLKKEVELLRSALDHALTCPEAGKAAQLEKTDPYDVMRKVECPPCLRMILAKRGDP